MPVAYSAVLNPSRVELACICQLPVANLLEFANWHQAAVFQLPIQLLCSKALSIRIDIWLPAVSCQFARTDELGTSCLLPVSIHLLFSIITSNRIGIWLPAASCLIHKNLRISIRLPSASYLFSCYALKPSQSELISDCQLPAANSPVLTNWELAAFCRLLNHLVYFITTSNRIGWLPVANAQEFANRHLAAVCLLPIHVWCSKPLANRIGIWLPVANSQEFANLHLAAVCRFSFNRLKPSKIRLEADCQLPIAKFTRIC